MTNTNQPTETETNEITASLFTQWANENAAKIKMLAHLQTLTEAEKIALFKEVMGSQPPPASPERGGGQPLLSSTL